MSKNPVSAYRVATLRAKAQSYDGDIGRDAHRNKPWYYARHDGVVERFSSFERIATRINNGTPVMRRATHRAPTDTANHYSPAITHKTTSIPRGARAAIRAAGFESFTANQETWPDGSLLTHRTFIAWDERGHEWRQTLTETLDEDKDVFYWPFERLGRRELWERV